MARDPRIERGMLAQLTERRRRIDAGERPLGWKLGMSAPAMMDKLGIEAPLVGYLMEAALVSSDGTVDVSGWSNARVETEIAVHMRADLSGGASRDDAAAAAAGLGAAIELVDPDPDADDPEAILAANIFQRGVVLGPVQEGATTDGATATASLNGEEKESTADVTAATGHPLDLLLHVASTLEAAGERLRAGDVVICGTVVAPLAIGPGDAVEVAVEPLGRLRVLF